MVCSVMEFLFGSVANIDRFTMLIPAGARLTPSHVREMTEATGLTLHIEPDTLKPCGNCGGHGLDCTVCKGDGVIYPY